MNVKFLKMRKPTAIVLAIVILCVFVLGSFAFFADREDTKLTLSTASFTKDGYTISRTVESGPYVAGESIEITLTEDNEKTEPVQSDVTLTAKWISPDISCSPFGNENAADNVVVKVDGTALSSTNYSYDEDTGIFTFTLPTHKMDASTSDNKRVVTFEIPASLKSTGTFDIDFTDVKLSQSTAMGGTGFYAEYDHDELNADTSNPMDFTADVVWDLSASQNKSVIGVLSGTSGSFTLDVTSKVDDGVMKDWASDTASAQSNYKGSITIVNIGDNIDNIGDYAFASFSKLTSVEIPADVSDIGSNAFGSCTNVTEITFNQDASANITIDSGAFYVGSPYSTTNPLGTKVNTTNQDVLDYNWTANNRGYTVTVNKVEHGTATANPSVAINGKTITLTSKADTGYSYNGATVSYGDDTIILKADETIFTMPVGDVTVTPKWTANEYTVIFDANGGAGTMDDASFTYDAEGAKLPKNAFTREGYEFAGWAESEGGEVKYDDEEEVKNLTSEADGTVTLYAKWDVLDYTITYEPNEGTMPESYDSSYNVEDHITKLPEPTRDGYEFVGWHEKEDLSDDVVTSTEGETGDKTYYAEWKVVDYTISYDLNGGTLPTGKTNPTSYNIEDESFTLNNPTKTGYTFAGWTGSNGTTAQTTVTIQKGSTGTKSYAANWTANAYTVKYNANGGTGTMADSSFRYDTEVALTKNAFTKTGYTFAGWAESATGTVKYSDQQKVKNLSSTAGATVNLYAKWNVVDYTITYEPNGGTMPDSYDSSYNVEDHITKLPEPTKDGYEFVGWHEKEDLTDEVVTSTEGETGDKKYYAEWKIVAIPMLAKQDTWQYVDDGSGNTSTSIDFDVLTTINIVDTYDPDGTETSWDASAYETVNGTEYMGKVTAYLSADKNTLTLAGNGYGGIYANPDSLFAFSSYDNQGFDSLTRINGAEILDTRLVTDAGGMFSDNDSLEYVNVSNWDTSNIIYTNWGYYGMFGYNPSLKEIDVATKTVTRADGTTYTAWDTSSMESMCRMFFGDEALEEVDVSGWDTSSCEDLSQMFTNTKISSIAVDADGWDTSKVTTTYGMFSGCSNLTSVDLTGWDVSSLTDVRNMFKESGIKSINLSTWDESIVTKTYGMFEFCASLESVNIDGWNLSNVTDSMCMFRECTALKELTIPASLTSIGQYFANGCTSLTKIEFLHEASATISFPTAGTYGAFYVGTPYTETAPLGTKVITSNATVLDYKWNKDHRGYTVTVHTATGGTLAANQTVAINGKTITLTPTASSGYGYNGATVSYTDETGAAKTISLNASTNTFTMPVGDVAITPKWEFTEIAQAIYSATDNSLTFIRDRLYAAGETYNGKAVTAVYTGFETSAYSSSSYVPWASYSSSIKSVLVKDEIQPVSTANWFSGFTNCSSFDVQNLDVSNVTNMKSMFYSAAKNVSTFKVSGMDNWDVSNVTNMNNMFGDVPTWVETGSEYTSYSLGNLSNWDTSNVTDMSYMFTGFANSVENWDISSLGLNNWDTSRVTNYECMFDSAGFDSETFTLDLSGFDLGNVSSIDLGWIFSDAGYNATSFNISGIDDWNVSNVTDMNGMFLGAGDSATSWSIGDLSSWNTSKVTDMSGMFASAGYNAQTFNIGDIGNWDVSNVTKFSDGDSSVGMFDRAGYSAKTFYIGDLSNWDTSNAVYMHTMFYQAGYSASYTQDLRGWNVSKVVNAELFNEWVESKVLAPTFNSGVPYALDGSENTVLPEGSIIGAAQFIYAMPDVVALNTEASANAPENTILFGWLVNSGMAEQVVSLEDFEAVLDGIYSEEAEWQITITPLYQPVQETETEETEATEPTEEVKDPDETTEATNPSEPDESTEPSEPSEDENNGSTEDKQDEEAEPSEDATDPSESAVSEVTEPVIEPSEASVDPTEPSESAETEPSTSSEETTAE